MSSMKELILLMEGERVSLLRRSPLFRREINIFPETLNEAQRQRLEQIEQELIAIAHDAHEELTVKTVLKKPDDQAS